jgi:hypothetical protein
LSHAVRREPGRKAGLLFVALLLLGALGGCATGGGDDVEAAVGAPREMAEPAAPLPAGESVELTPTSAPAPTPAPTAAGDPSTPSSTAQATTSTTTAAGTSSNSSATGPWRRVAETADAARDADNGAPVFADLTGVVVEERGDEVRVAIALAGDVPAKLADGEVVGLGFDLFRTGGKESDFQLFLDGGTEGWFAYLQTPTGFVEYPGSLLVGQRQIVFVVPVASIGGPGAVSFSVFLDYSKEQAVRNVVTSDKAPESGRTALTL